MIPSNNTYLIIFGFFLFIIFLITKKSKVCSFLLLLQTGTLIAAFLIDGLPKIETFIDYGILLFTLLILTFFIVPWKNFISIKVITTESKERSELLFKILIVFNIFVIIVFSYFSFNVLTTVKDIFAFKEAGISSLSVSTSSSARLYTLAQIFYPLGYLMLPFHFYYLSNKRIKKSIISFILSLTPIFYGLTYFSRSHPIHYFLSYIILYLLLKDSLPNSYKIKIRKIALISLILFTLFFITISIARFEFSNYYLSVASSSIITNPVLYSILDYFGQWHYFNYDCLSLFDGNTMHGQMAFYPLGELFRVTGMIPSTYDVYMSNRMSILGDSYDNFIGLVAYLIYDFGFLFTIVIGMVYAKIVKSSNPKFSTINLERIFFIFLLIQIPLISIFYSYFDVLIQTLFYFFPIFFISYYTKPRKAK